ncbi:hypothetical protein ASG71_11705 [Arthrobacter sp. Soil763]|nr:hypothetical protein ASG71_11705 [Arthrobacter sp. Soil763]
MANAESWALLGGFTAARAAAVVPTYAAAFLVAAAATGAGTATAGAALPGGAGDGVVAADDGGGDAVADCVADCEVPLGASVRTAPGLACVTISRTTSAARTAAAATMPMVRVLAFGA